MGIAFIVILMVLGIGLLFVYIANLRRGVRLEQAARDRGETVPRRIGVRVAGLCIAAVLIGVSIYLGTLH